MIGDDGAGPNHTLPTGAAARFSAGLTVFSSLRVQTWLEIEEPGAAGEQYAAAVALASMGGLSGHAAAARARRR